MDAEIYDKDNSCIGTCILRTDESGIHVEGADGSEVTTVPPEQYIDIGFPGFFAGRAYLEIPIDDRNRLCLRLQKADLYEFRRTIDEEIGRNYAHLLKPKLSFHNNIVYGGVALAVVGLVICIGGFAAADEIGFGVIFYGLPIAGIAMICSSVSQIRRIKAIITNAGISEASLE